jgi:hypothetical protein
MRNFPPLSSIAIAALFVLANCASTNSAGLATEVSQLSFGPVNIQTACVENGRTIDQANPFSPTSNNLFTNRFADLSNFYLFPELRAEPTVFGRLQDQLVLRTRQINDNKIEIWFQFEGPFPGYCAHILSSDSPVFALWDVQGSSFQLPADSGSDTRTRDAINKQIGNCVARTADIQDLLFFPRDCVISVEVGGITTGEGCQCFDHSLAIPARTVRLVLKTNERLFVVSIIGSEIIVESLAFGTEL